ncbi:ACETYL-COA-BENZYLALCOHOL ACETYLTRANSFERASE-LIKE [Salix koriyanagi]|uniref:ACETYL-COA-BENZYLALCOHOL ACETYLTRANSFERASE-LIKE n=1 Tax=Salix koriyanagi TaxID=2511006 RepID=A0A9Q0ZUT7_9ROSI|nr:ACETYL-COA-BENZYLALCOHOL ACETYLTRANSFERASE-LIKE [Salix koriyanagi]
MKVQILSRKLIAPSSPNPPNLQNLKISCFDQLAPPTYVPRIFYYPVSGEDHGGNNADRSKKVEKSLAETLTLFYPLGGRYIEENLSIECNDEGAEYLEAQVSDSLSQLLGREEFKTEMRWRLVPQVFRPENNPPLTIQFNRFECGGVATGSCAAHRIADAYTVGTFINTRAAACRMGIGKVHRCPGFPSGSLFPPKNIPATTSVDDLISAGAIKKHGEKKREMPT